jgi:hypothetical protein
MTADATAGLDTTQTTSSAIPVAQAESISLRASVGIESYEGAYGADDTVNISVGAIDPSGDVPRPVSGVWRGVPFHIQRGLAHQIAFGPLAPGAGNRGTHEPPDLGIVEIAADGLRVHQRPILYDGPDFLLRDEAARRARRLG